MKWLLLVLSVQFCKPLMAQNVGIGTNTPLSKLHISQGSSGNGTPFSPLVVEGSGNTYINVLSPNVSETGILFGKASDAASGGIVYNNFSNLNGFQFRTNGNSVKMVLDQNGNMGIGNSDPSFILDVSKRIRIRSEGNITSTAGIWFNRTDNLAMQSFFGIENDTYAGIYGSTSGWSLGVNTTNGNVKIMGRLGIGTTSPNAPLSFPPTLEKKITLYPGATGDVGFAVAGNRLQIYSDNPNADVAIGYDAAGTFNERFAVKANGALALTGNTGAAGLVIQSNGAGGGVTWVSPTNSLFNNSNMVTTTALLLVSSAMAPTLIPGLSHTFSVSGNAKVLVSFTIHVNSIT